MRGTLLNTSTVAGGAIVGLAISRVLQISPSFQGVVLSGLGLVTMGIGVKLFLQSKNLMIVAGAIALGGMLGLAVGIDSGLNLLGEWMKLHLGGGGRFTEGLVTTSVLYCVGPMTLMGCIQDGLEGKSELLQLKSVMDGITAIFFAAAMGSGVLITALIVLIFQGSLTLMARPLRRYAEDEELMSEATGAGGILMLGIGLGLLDIKHVGIANFLPSLFLAPLFVILSRRFKAQEKSAPGN